jgi:hypothetical protein
MAFALLHSFQRATLGFTDLNFTSYCPTLLYPIKLPQ